MKTKISINRLSPAFASVLLVSVIFCGCESEKSETKIKENQKYSGRKIYEYGWNTKVRVFEIDSCEYIGFDAGTEGGTSIIHKQNCKFCVKRSKK